MNDLISRQQAIDLLNDGAELLKRVLDDTDIVGVERKIFEWELRLIESYISDLKELPSARQWTPCDEEHLPKKDGRYLVTNDGWGEWIVDWNAWLNGQWLYNSEPVAWMPLPEPYKGEEE